MAISDDWDFDYANVRLSHIDGVLSYDTGGGRQAAVGEYIRGNTSGAIGKILSVTGNTTSGTLTLTNVEGLWEDNETFEVMSEVGFDVDQVTGSVVVRAIEYNEDGLGGGIIYGDTFTAFTNDSQLDISGGQADVADADTATANVDNDAALTTTQTDGTLAVPGTAQTNDSVIIHYDAGTVAIPEQALLEDATTGAIGLVEQVYGTLLTGAYLRTIIPFVLTRLSPTTTRLPVRCSRRVTWLSVLLPELPVVCWLIRALSLSLLMSRAPGLILRTLKLAELRSLKPTEPTPFLTLLPVIFPMEFVQNSVLLRLVAGHNRAEFTQLRTASISYVS
jgi:hypothetical protein